MDNQELLVLKFILWMIKQGKYDDAIQTATELIELTEGERDGNATQL